MKEELSYRLEKCIDKALPLCEMFISLKVQFQMLVKPMTREDKDYVAEGEITAACRLQRES